MISTASSGPLALRNSSNDRGIEMDSIGNDVCGKPRVGEHFANDSRLAMIKRPHRIKRVRRVPCSGRDTSRAEFQIGIRMSQADADSPSRGLGNHFQRTIQFGSNRHHANVSTRRLPEAVE